LIRRNDQCIDRRDDFLHPLLHGNGCFICALTVHSAPCDPPLSRCFNLVLLISAILNPVNSDIRQVLKLTISLVLLGLLSGCFAAETVFLVGDLARLPGSGSYDYSSLSGVLCTTKDSIGVKYKTAEPNVQHDEAMQVITEHCVNGYVETKRVEYADSRIVYATCLRADGSPAVSQPCVDSDEQDADEQVGFGEER
jgi:hypothetical protein